jgi:hypothetical protein
MPIVSFGATKVRRESPDLECHYGPFGRAGDSIMNIREANKLDAERCGRILYDAFCGPYRSRRRFIWASHSRLAH